MTTNVAPGASNFVRFNGDATDVIQSGFNRDAFTICSGLVYYNPEAKTCAVVHGPPGSPVFKEFYDWLKGAVEPPGTKLIVIYPQVQGSNPGRYFGASLALMQQEHNCAVIVAREGKPASKTNWAVKVRCDAEGWKVTDSKDAEVAGGAWNS